MEPEVIEARMDSLYLFGREGAYFDSYGAQLRGILDLCKERDIEIYLVVPPTMIGAEPGAERMLTWLETQREDYDFKLEVWTNVMREHRFFYDWDHMNTEGVKHMMVNYMKPLMAGEVVQASPRAE